MKEDDNLWQKAMSEFLKKEATKTRKSCSLDRIDIVYKLLIRPCKSYVNALFNTLFSRNLRKQSKLQCYQELC